MWKVSTTSWGTLLISMLWCIFSVLWCILSHDPFFISKHWNPNPLPHSAPLPLHKIMTSKFLTYVQSGLQVLNEDLIEGIESNSVEKIPDWKMEMVGIFHRGYS